MGALVKVDKRPNWQKVSEMQQYLTFALGGEMFAVETFEREGDHRIRPAHGGADDAGFIRGVINLRGAVGAGDRPRRALRAR